MITVAFVMSLAIIFAAAGDILFSRGMRAAGEMTPRSLRDVPPLVVKVISSPLIFAGVCAMGMHMCSYITVLAWIDVSVANPLTALSYVLATAYAAIVLRERVDRSRWTGIALISIGAAMIGASSR